MSWDALIPKFNVEYFTSLSILVFAVGGCEKISPYVNKVENPAKNFPKGMIALAIMVMVCAILGTVALGMMFSGAEITGEAQASFIANGAYEAFQRLGEYYHVGNLFVIFYGACNAIGQFSTLVLSIDAPLRMLLDDESARQYVPKQLLKKNQYGAYTNGIKLVVVLSGSIIAIQLLGKDASDIITWLTRLNSVCMPLRYLWVFFAYIMLRKQSAKFPRDYQFVKNNKVALFFGVWCFVITATFCILGMYDSQDPMRTVLNALSPFVFILLGMIMPMIRKRQDEKRYHRNSGKRKPQERGFLFLLFDATLQEGGNTMNDLEISKELLEFIQASPSMFHSIHTIKSYLEKENYTYLPEGKPWKLEKGGKYYSTRNNSSIIAFQIGNELSDYHFQMSAAHSDSPTYKIKSASEILGPGEYLKLNVEAYGGMIDSTWFDRPLSVAGRVLVKEDGAIKINYFTSIKMFC